MDISGYIEAILVLLGAAVSAVIWLVRLEGKHSGLAERHEALRVALAAVQSNVDAIRGQQQVIEGDLSKELRQIQVELAQIKGFLMSEHDYGTRAKQI